MDPNAALTRLRELATWDSDHSDDSVIDKLSELQEQIAALDEWLSQGGFPPGAWDKAFRAHNR